MALRRRAKGSGAASIALAAALLIGGAGAGFAATPSWEGKPYEYVVVDQDVRGVLTEFGRNLGLPVVLTDKVRGRVRGEIRSKTADEFLKRVCEAQDLTWYFDGTVLHVSADEEFSTQVIDAGVDGSALSREIDRLDLSDKRFAIRATPSSGLVGVSGPPAYVQIVRETAERMKPPARIAGEDPRVRVFRGGAREEVVRTAPQSTQAQPTPVKSDAGDKPAGQPQ